MILSSYRNPPYRTPTPKGHSISPPPGHSPSRRGSNTLRQSPPLYVNTVAVSDGIPDTPADSPRARVAERLRGLNIDRQSPALPESEHRRAGSPSPRKRLKRERHLRSPRPDYELHRHSTPEPSSRDAIDGHLASPPEISETPQLQQHISPPSRARPVTAYLYDASDPAPDETLAMDAKSRRLRSPPPQVPVVSTETLDNVGIASSSQSADDDFFDRTSLTWQDSEITGQDIDLTIGDDDGEGINGIGFKPTAAIAYARSQKRKQQVDDWRAREARDARQRRMDRRRGVSRTNAKNSRNLKRNVRFEESDA
jgi:hypothetical protein